MFVYKTGIPAMDDQELILNAANDLLNNVPDMWDKGAYCYRFPNQNGFVLFVALGLKMFGPVKDLSSFIAMTCPV